MTQMTRVPELQRIAAMNVALCLWNHVDDIPRAACQKNKSSNRYQSILVSVHGLIAQNMSVLLPSSILELVEEYVKKVHNEIICWVSYHQQSIFFDVYEYHLISHFDHFVWDPDGTVNHALTALRLQSSLRLSELEKFRFLCHYCLKDEIVQKWKLLFENQTFDSVPFEENPLLYYWYCFCRNRLHLVPVTGSLSIDESMFRRRSVNNWPAKQYFFDRLNVDEQIQNAIWIIDSEFPTFQKNLIDKLNPAQRTTLYTNRSTSIFKNYCQNADLFDHILPTWYEAVAVITADDFCSILGHFLQKNIDRDIVTEVWISAPDAFKIHVLNSNQAKVIESVWDFWMAYYDRDMLKLLLNASPNIRDEIKAMKMFIDHCKRFLIENKLTMLFSVLNLCFLKSSEFHSFKRTFAQNDWFNKHFKNLIVLEEFSSLERLCDFFFEAIDLNEVERDLVESSVLVHHCRYLLENGKISELEKFLNFFFSNVEKSKRWIRDLYGADSFLRLWENLTIECKLNRSDMDKIFHIFDFGAEDVAQMKQNLVAKPLFGDRCLKFIYTGEISNLEICLQVFPSAEEAVRFKQSLREKIISADYCEKFVTEDEISKMERLLKFFNLADEELVRLRENLTRKFVSNKDYYCKLGILLNSFPYCSLADKNEFKRDIVRNDGRALIIARELSALTLLFDSLYSQSVSQREIVKEIKTDMTKEKFFIDHCLELIKNDELSMFNELLKFSLGGYNFRKSRAAYKKKLAGEATFRIHCENLIRSNELAALNTMLTWILCDEQDLARYKKNLAHLENVKERCLRFFATENLKGLDDLLTVFFPLDSVTMLEYKQNLLLSEQGIEICFRFVDRPEKILADMISKRLSYDSLIDFEREIIFSSTAISLLKKMIAENQLENVLKCCQRFSFSNEDKKMLRMRLWDSPNDMVTTWFFKSDQNTFKLLIKWWLSDRNAYRECKNELSVDEIFEAGLKECLFESIDACDRSGQMSFCVFKENFDVNSLNRFLSWYFESSNKIKEYKAQKMKAYKIMETIRVLLEKRAEISYFNEILSWFFEKDAPVISKFKKGTRKLQTRMSP